VQPFTWLRYGITTVYKNPQIPLRYCISKYGVIGLTRSAANEVGERGIRVNVIAPSVSAFLNLSAGFCDYKLKLPKWHLLGTDLITVGVSALP
jgi:NAD(P)-dependent dehydrogenase (short-subunit alcohol dehydrogenase family)